MWAKWNVYGGAGQHHITLFSVALPGGEAFWVGHKWYDQILIIMPQEAMQAPDILAHNLPVGNRYTITGCVMNSGCPDHVMSDGNKWHHIALTGSPVTAESKRNVKLYIDGDSNPVFDVVRDVDTTLWPPSEVGSVAIGQGQSRYKTLHHSHKHFDATNLKYLLDLAEVRFWNIERSGVQINAAYKERWMPMFPL
jgi:hypothetical protein